MTPVAQRLAVELSLPVQRFRSVPTGDRTPISRMRGERFTTTPPLWLSSSYEKGSHSGGAFLRAFALHHEGADVQISAATDI